jgi:serine protease Do
MASSLGANNAKGAIIASVIEGSPAARGRLRQGHVIVSLNGAGVDDSRDLTRRVALLPTGSKAEFTILRDGRRESLTTTISTRNEKTASAETGRRSDTAQPSDSMLGMELGPATRGQDGIDNGAKGVVVTSIDPDSDAADKGV